MWWILAILTIGALLLWWPVRFAQDPATGGAASAEPAGAGSAESGGPPAEGAAKPAETPPAEKPAVSPYMEIFSQLSEEDQAYLFDAVREKDERERKGDGERGHRPAAEETGEADKYVTREEFERERQARADEKAQEEQRKKQHAFFQNWLKELEDELVSNEYSKGHADLKFLRECARGVAATRGRRDSAKATREFINEFQEVVKRAAEPMAEERLETWKRDFLSGKVKTAASTKGEVPSGAAPAKAEEEAKADDLESGEILRRARARQGLAR